MSHPKVNSLGHNFVALFLFGPVRWGLSVLPKLALKAMIFLPQPLVTGIIGICHSAQLLVLNYPRTGVVELLTT